MSEEVFDGFGEDVEFDVDFVAGFFGGKGGVLPSVGDDGDLELALLGIDDGEADAVETDGGFVEEVFGVLGADIEGDGPGGGVLLDGDDGAGLVDVALDDVAAVAVDGAHGAFEVDGGAFLETIEGGFGVGFFADVE